MLNLTIKFAISFQCVFGILFLGISVSKKTKVNLDLRPRTEMRKTTVVSKIEIFDVITGKSSI